MSSAVLTYEEQFTREVKAIPPEYRPALLEIVRLFRQSVTLPPAEVGFRQGWQEAMLGETKPVYDLWEEP